MYQLYRKGARPEPSTTRSFTPAVPELAVPEPQPATRSWKANLALFVAFLLFVGVVLYAGGDQLSSALAASGSFVYTSVTGVFGSKQPVSIATAAPSVVQTAAAVPVSNAKVELVATDATVKVETAVEEKVITTIQHEGKTLKIIDEPIPDDCYATQHADYDGYAVKWGLGHKVRSAKECCQLCKDFKRDNPTSPQPCNIWVWCGDPSGTCWTMDIHSHTTGDCWLKFQEGWDNEPDLTKTNLKINHLGKFSDEFKQEHRTAPEMVPWVAGLIPAPKQERRR